MKVRFFTILLASAIAACSSVPHNVDDNSAAKSSAEQKNRTFEAIGVPQPQPHETWRGI